MEIVKTDFIHKRTIAVAEINAAPNKIKNRIVVETLMVNAIEVDALSQRSFFFCFYFVVCYSI